MISTYATSAIRTASAYLVGWLLSFAAVGQALGLIGVDTVTAREWMSGLLVFVLGTVYYLLVRLLEQKWPSLGVLLGVPTKPVYEKPVAVDPQFDLSGVTLGALGPAADEREAKEPAPEPAPPAA